MREDCTTSQPLDSFRPRHTSPRCRDRGGCVSAFIGLQCHLCKAHVPGRSARTSASSASARSSRSTTTAPIHADARGDRAAAEEPVALPRAAADHRRAAHRLQLRLHAARALRLAWPSASACSELYIKDDSVNHPTLSYKDRVVSVAATRAVELGFEVLACASTGNLANSVAAHAARLGLECCVFIPDNLEAGQAARLGDLRPDDSRHRRQLRRCEPAVHAGGGSVRLGLRQHQPALVLRRRREDDGLRDRRAARLALSAAPRVAGRRRHAAAAHRARASASCARSASSTASCRASTRRRRPAARRSSTRSTPALDYPEPVRPDTIAKSIAIGNPADGYQVIQTRAGDRRHRRGGHRRRRSSTRFSCWPRPKASSPSRPAARRSPRRSISIERGVIPPRRIDRRLRHRQRLQDRRSRGGPAADAGAASAARSRNSKRGTRSAAKARRPDAERRASPTAGVRAVRRSRRSAA